MFFFFCSEIGMSRFYEVLKLKHRDNSDQIGTVGRCVTMDLFHSSPEFSNPSAALVIAKSFASRQ